MSPMKKLHLENKSEVITFRVTPTTAERLKKIAQLDGRSDSNVISFCVDRMLPELERQHGISVAEPARETLASKIVRKAKEK